MENNAADTGVHELRKAAGAAFASIARALYGKSTILTWTEASGNLNKNYRKIVLESGKGIAGAVYQLQKAIIVQDTEQEYEENEIVHSPIILAEEIRSFAAFPLWKGDRVEGVLLIAMREAGMITRDRFELVKELGKGGIGGLFMHEESFDAASEVIRPREYKSLPIYELVEFPISTALRDERNRIARDLHDSVIQNLTGVQMQLRLLKYAKTMEEVMEGLQVADESLSAISKELREILVSVKPKAVEELGIVEAFEKHFRFLENSFGIRIHFTQDIGDRRFDPEIEKTVYRIGQEATANACKYSLAQELEVSLTRTAGLLRLKISDDGIGFDMERLTIEGTGMGLPGMRYWAGSIGAALDVKSSRNEGTQILLEIPLEGR